MKMRLVQALLLMVVILALVNVASTATSWTTPGPHGLNLNGKMFTLSLNRGGISFFPPSWPSTPSSTTSPYYSTTKRSYSTTKHPYTTTRHHHTTTKRSYSTTTKRSYSTTTMRPHTTTMHSYSTTNYPNTPTTRPHTTTTHSYSTTNYPNTTTTRPHTTTTRPHTTTTTAPSVRGVSVCLRYLTDFGQTSDPRIFTLSPSGTPLQVNVNQFGYYTLKLQPYDPYGYNALYMKPSIKLWSNIGPDIWSRFCFTLDSMKNVAQVFSGSNISIRMVLPYQYVWSGEPVIEFPGFDGQLTDVQMWDYPLSYREVFKYMNNGVYGPYRGSVLTWSSINYTPRGNTLLEDVYEWQTKQQISGRRRGRRPKGGRKNRKFVNVVEREEGVRNLL